MMHPVNRTPNFVLQRVNLIKSTKSSVLRMSRPGRYSVGARASRRWNAEILGERSKTASSSATYPTLPPTATATAGISLNYDATSGK